MNSFYSNSILHLFVVISYFSTSNAFQITKTSIDPNQSIKVGATVRLACQSDAAYEYCIWRHKNRVCQFEWKRAHDEVKKQTCAELNDRAHFRGSYDDHECSIDLENVQLSDEGEWSCEMEHYVWGPARGSTHKKSLNVIVIPKLANNSNILQLTSTPKSLIKSATSEASGVDEQSAQSDGRGITETKFTPFITPVSTSRSGQMDNSQNHSSTTTSLFINPSESNANINTATIEQRNLPFNHSDDALAGSGKTSVNINKPTLTAIIPILFLLLF